MKSGPARESLVPAMLARFVPALSWLPGYQRGWLTSDAIAGFTIWGAALPGDHHLRGPGVRLDQLKLKQVAGHPETASRIQQLLGEEEAAGAVQVADRPGGLGQQVKGSWGARG